MTLENYLRLVRVGTKFGVQGCAKRDGYSGRREQHRIKIRHCWEGHGASGLDKSEAEQRYGIVEKRSPPQPGSTDLFRAVRVIVVRYIGICSN
jgi:hypothetical protein